MDYEGYRQTDRRLTWPILERHVPLKIILCQNYMVKKSRVKNIWSKNIFSKNVGGKNGLKTFAHGQFIGIEKKWLRVNTRGGHIAPRK